MDKIEEIRELKKLLDDGVITEEDFAREKSKILGISIEEKIEDEEQEDRTIHKINVDEYINEKETNNVTNNEENIHKKESNEDFYEKERLREKARLDAREELLKQRKEELNKNITGFSNKMISFIKGVLAVVLIIFGIALISGTTKEILNLPIGIIFIILGLMSSPKITNKTKEYEMYTKYKKIIVWMFIILLFILISITGRRIK